MYWYFIFLYLVIAKFNYRQKVLIVTSSRYTPPNTSSDIVDCFSLQQLLVISAIRHLLMNSGTFFPEFIPEQIFPSSLSFTTIDQ